MRLWLGGMSAVATLMGCTAEPVGPSNSLVLDGDGVSGMIEVVPAQGCAEASVRVGLWGPHFGTPGLVSATVEATDDGLSWLHFVLETGLGEGEAALRLQGAEALLPLGGRRGEFEIRLEAQPGVLSVEERRQRDDALEARLETQRANWAAGAFRLMDAGDVVGELQLRGEEPPWVWVYDAWWLTPAPTVAALGSEGGDLLFGFPVEPRLDTEEALLRVNVANLEAVVPLDSRPSAADRHLSLLAGPMDPSLRTQRLDAARAAAGEAELEWVRTTLPGLAAELTTESGCRSLAELDEAWTLLTRGYDLQVLANGDGCAVGVEPTLPQHRRRFAGVVTRDGLTTGGLRGESADEAEGR